MIRNFHEKLWHSWLNRCTLPTKAILKSYLTQFCKSDKHNWLVRCSKFLTCTILLVKMTLQEKNYHFCSPPIFLPVTTYSFLLCIDYLCLFLSWPDNNVPHVIFSTAAPQQLYSRFTANMTFHLPLIFNNKLALKW